MATTGIKVLLLLAVLAVAAVPQAPQVQAHHVLAPPCPNYLSFDVNQQTLVIPPGQKKVLGFGEATNRRYFALVYVTGSADAGFYIGAIGPYLGHEWVYGQWPQADWDRPILQIMQPFPEHRMCFVLENTSSVTIEARWVFRRVM